jgi:hypothetical protein
MRRMAARTVWILGISGLLVALPSQGLAGGWPSSGRMVALGFGDTYRAPSGDQRTHHGCDIVGTAGEQVSFPAAGTIAFAGRVPGSHGGSVLAVTVEMGDARRLTMLPLERLDVSAGSSVDEGDIAGSLAESGDPSSVLPHVHVSLRAGDLYVDPLTLLALPQPSASDAGSADGQESVVDGGATPAPDAQPAGVASGGHGMAAEPKSAPLVQTTPQVASGVEEAAANEANGDSPQLASPGGTIVGLSSVSAALSTTPQGLSQARFRLKRLDERVERSTHASYGPSERAIVAALSRDVRPASAWQAFGLRIGDLGRGWITVALSLSGLAALWPLWRRGGSLITHGRNAGGSPVGSEVVAAPGR